ncbi:MAG: chemotaxis protein CheW [Anaerolineales bacterium]|nr:chemotaxis protein CheW [Anaerolineales bacterium]
MSIDWNAIRTTIQETQQTLETDTPSPAVRGAILQRRADQLAERNAAPNTTADTFAVLTFTCGNEHYAVSVQSVLAVLPIRTLTPIPCVPTYYRGIINWNSKIISVLDIVSLFEGAAPSPQREQFVVVVQGSGLEIGLNVNTVGVVTEIAQRTLVSAQTIGQDWLDGISAVSAEGLTVLNADQLFRDPRIHIYEEA